MKTIGTIFFETRKSKGLTIFDIEQGTKIKSEFIGHIEAGNWKDLPPYPVLSGFIKNIADFLNIDNKKALAIFKRDYPPQNLVLSPKPDVAKKFMWGPKTSFVVGLITLTLLVCSYLVFQYFSSQKPPTLQVYLPQDNAIVQETSVEVSGKTSPDATITANNQPILVSDNGDFGDKIAVFEGTESVKVVAKSRDGKETAIERTIKVELAE